MLNETDVVVVSLRALAFVAVFHAAGGAIFLSLFGTVLVDSDRAIRNLMVTTAAVACLLIVTQHFLEPARMTASFSGVWDTVLQEILLQSDAGAARAVRITGLIVIAWSGFNAHASQNQLGLIGAIVVLGSFILMGHTAAHPYRWVLAPLLLLHLIVGALWFGALLAFWFTSIRERIDINAELLQRFSAIAVWFVPFIFIAGVVMTALLVPDISAFTTPYGLLLIGKLCGFTGLIFLAAWNKMRLVPAIATGESAALETLRRVVGIEWALIMTILVLTAIMTGLFGPDQI